MKWLINLIAGATIKLLKNEITSLKSQIERLKVDINNLVYDNTSLSKKTTDYANNNLILLSNYDEAVRLNKKFEEDNKKFREDSFNFIKERDALAEQLELSRKDSINLSKMIRERDERIKERDAIIKELGEKVLQHESLVVIDAPEAVKSLEEVSSTIPVEVAVGQAAMALENPNKVNRKPKRKK